MRYFVLDRYLYLEAVRIAKKDNPNYDNMSEAAKNRLIAQLMEELKDKYSEEY